MESSKSRLSTAIAETLPEVVFESDLNGNLTFVNNNALKIFGYKKEDLENKLTAFDTIVPEDHQRIRDNLERLARGESSGWNEYTALKKDGSTFPCEVKTALIRRNGTVTGFQGILIDITRRKLLEKAIVSENEKLQSQVEELDVSREILNLLTEKLESMVRERTKEVEKLLKQKEDFINQLGHDLKNPLTPLVALLPLIEKREKDPESRKLIDILIKNVDYMRKLVEKILWITRLNAEKDEIKIETFSLTDTVESVLKKMEFVAHMKKIELRSAVVDEFAVQADRVYLEELFSNLVENGLKYTPTGGSITIGACGRNGTVTVSIDDSGIGMSKEQISRMFDEFYKADESRHDLQSSGLGLSICRKIVEKQGGRIWAESSGLGEGTSIYFTLEAAPRKILTRVDQGES
jgi:PAS domain S-box-containing protein